ncbi:low specificity L-threonine aldolase [Brevibacillus fluminis]|uniref:Low specificity L-threonine aldolase n=1 Tax=Brevibacillus fluminis TaxID=511487 RepID=A0A3M8DHL9_9BACL|nr:low specificity L-threonine aldolase [Brevibacillus fluminis]RNB86971.1 low specificity L-threonine aldolase [Brevibacillus fluminis]
MIRFESDYTEGAHERILKRLVETNEEQTSGYGVDPHCERAREFIKKECDTPNAEVHFLVGGTQTNTTVIASILRPHQGAVTATTGHIAVHETGAIEATGHKVLTVPSADGKITAEQVKEVYDAHWNDVTHEHMVQPGLVYISHPTENGTTYTKAELEALSKVCRECGLPLFMDGARMGYGLAAPDSDLSLADIAKLCDVFYIGGTKVGALLGEAVVIVNDALKKDFRYMIKQRGGMLAKGRLLGIQFETLFEDGLYVDIARHAVDLAIMIRDAFAKKGYPFRYASTTNQQFPILPDDVLAKLKETYSFSFWEKFDDTHSVVRFCTSWATKRENVERLVADIEAL